MNDKVRQMQMTGYSSHDNRRHKRHKLAYPVTLYQAADDVPATTAAGDLSDGGIFMTLPNSQAPDVDSSVDLTFSVPRTSSRVECFSVAATVVRRAAMPNEALSGVAMQFKRPVALRLG